MGLRPDSAAAVVHLFRSDRPGQARNVPDITPALPLFANLRRYTLAVISAAELAALPGGALYTGAPANGEADDLEPKDLIELERGMFTPQSRLERGLFDASPWYPGSWMPTPYGHAFVSIS